MKYLFDSRGHHIANLVDDQLHSPTGENIGHYLEDEGVFVDMSGRYLGEIVEDDRLVYCTFSPHQSVNYGNFGNYGNAGNYGNPGHAGTIGLPGGYVDIPAERLKP